MCFVGGLKLKQIMRFINQDGRHIEPLEEIRCGGKEDFLSTGDFIKGRENRYRVVHKELDLTYGGGVKWNIDITVDNP